MELSAPLAAIKREEAGEDTLNDADRRHLRRASFSTAACDLLFPVELTDQGTSEVAHDLEALVGRLLDLDVPVFLFDMTRPDIAVHAVRAVSPALQPFTDTVSTDRLKRVQMRSDGAYIKAKDIPLM